jgi:hypothetical protein
LPILAGEELAFLCGGCQAYQTIPPTFHKQTKSTKKKKTKKQKKEKKNNKENNTENNRQLSPTSPGTADPERTSPAPATTTVGDDGWSRRPGTTGS